MPQFPHSCAVFISGLALIGSLNCSAVEPVREWKSGDGKTISGQLLWAQDGDVYIKAKKTGRKTKIAQSNFSVGDQAYIKRFLQEASEKKIAYQFQLAGEHFKKNEVGIIPSQRNGLFLIKSNKKGGTLCWTFEPTAPVPDSLLSKNATLQVSFGNGKDDGTKGKVSIWKNGQQVANRAGLGRAAGHKFQIPVASLLSSPTAGKTDQFIELRISAPGWDGIRVWGKTSPNPPTLRIYNPK